MIEKSQINFEDTATAFAHLTETELRACHLVFSAMNFPWVVKTGTFLISFALKANLPVKNLIKITLFDQFCGGESIEDSEPRMRKLAQANVKTILDYSVEGETTEKSYETTTSESLRISQYAAKHESIPFCVIKLTGIGSAKIMAKLQSGEKLSLREQLNHDKMLGRLEKIVKHAADHGVRFMIDAEESWIQKVIDQISIDLMLAFNKKRPVVYNTYQFYLKDALANMKKAHSQVEKAGYHFGAKLVRGAYMEKEHDRAVEQDYPDPIQESKGDTDTDYEEALKYAISNISKFGLCAGTHNEQSCQKLTSLMDTYGIAKTDERVYFAQLLGMSDNISFKLADMGYNVAKYVPYGPLEKVLPYLFRRAEENTAINGQSSRELLLIKKEIKRRKS